jgi:hypothetical protein
MDGKTKSAGNVVKDGEMKKSEKLPTRTEKLLTLDGKTKSAGNVVRDGEMKKSEKLPTRTEKLPTWTERRKVQEML